MKHALIPIVIALFVLAAYVLCYLWAVRPVAIVWFPGKHVPAYRWGNKSKPVFAPLLWIDTRLRPAYWNEDLDADPSW